MMKKFFRFFKKNKVLAQEMNLVPKKLKINSEDVVIGKKIGVGCFGEVRKSFSRSNESQVRAGHLKGSFFKRTTPVAIKIIDIGKASQEKCEKEISIMSQVSNKHTVKVYGVFFKNQKAHVVMELCDFSLVRLLRSHILTLREKLFYLIQIAKGMKHLHKKKVVHRDLKPGNILMSKGNTLKISDFGTAKHFSSITGTLCGTVEYLPPELYYPDKLKDPHLIDIFSFGILIWEVLSQRTPYQTIKKKCANNQLLLLKIIMEKKLRPSTRQLSSDIPPSLIELMKKCWATNPEDRIQTFEEIIKELKKIQYSKLYGLSL